MLGLPERKDCIRGLHPGCSIRPGRPLLGGNVRLTVVPPQPDINTLTELGPEAIITNLLWCFSHLFTSISSPPNPKRKTPPAREGSGVWSEGQESDRLLGGRLPVLPAAPPSTRATRHSGDAAKDQRARFGNGDSSNLRVEVGAKWRST